MFGLMLFLIGRFGWVYVVVIFGDNIGYFVWQVGYFLLWVQWCMFVIVVQFFFIKDEIVYCINVFEQFIVGDILYFVCCVGRVKFV